jgi:hypothetical protein
MPWERKSADTKYLRMSNAELAAYLYKTESNVRKTYSQGMHKLTEKEE